MKSIFCKNIEVLRFSDKTITNLRLQNYKKALDFSTRALDVITSVLDDIVLNQSYFNEVSIVVDMNYVNQMLSGLLEAQENNDYVLLADLFETQLNPFILNLQEIMIGKEEFVFDQAQYEENIRLMEKKDAKLVHQLKQASSPLQLLEQGYSVEYTSCGLMTLALQDKGKKYYLHSNGQVFHEAEILAREWFSDDKSEYIIYGLGLAYPINELLQLDENIIIRVYESDLNIIQIACGFTDMSNIFSCDRVEILYDPRFELLSSAIHNLKEDTSYFIHYPSLRNIKDIKIREQMEDYFISYSSINNQLHKLNGNFNKNILHCSLYVDSLKEAFAGKDLYIIAAGPSLDNNYMQLKELNQDAIIMATGTVFKKLLKAGIYPDYVIIIDANDGVYPQIENVGKTDIPLLYLSTVYYKIPECYQGKKYLVCQSGYKKAEDYAEKMGYSLFQTGGSVSTTALDIGIQFGCKRIIYLGLDLAYSNNYDHASETAAVNKVRPTDLRQVKDINGNMIGTSKNLDIYRKWIERRISGVKGIEFIDATEGGAKIEGMKIKKLSECQL